MDQEKAMEEMVGKDKLSHKGLNGGRNEFHGPSLAAPSKKAATMTVFLISILLLIGAFIVTRWGNSNVFDLTGDSFRKVWSYNNSTKPPVKKIEYSLNCSEGNMTQSCPVTRPVTFEASIPSSTTCPEYFRWIYEDLKPWRETGITREMVERAKVYADIRIIVVDGKVYVEKYKEVFQTRDVFTVWGILQLLLMYPGKLPNLELMFSCGDFTKLKKEFFQGPDAPAPPPLFHYCGDDETYDIVFPDWSYWSWPETNIKPWNTLAEDMKVGNNRTKWIDRYPYAYWKGNIYMGHVRKELSRCRNTNLQDWNVRIFKIDWVQETSNGFKGSDLASQCTHRYKLYAEGITWSVSEKYILACDSVSLLIKPRFYDFFTRSLKPLVHYWPIKIEDMCKSIKFATDWCNNHTEKAQEIGTAGSRFVHEKVKMKYVYDYMFHLLSMYASLLKYKPISVPEGAVEMCPDTMACTVTGLEKEYKIESMVRSPSDTGPCIMPPPFNPAELKHVAQKKDNVLKQVAALEEAANVGEETIENILRAK